jgi:rhodanese-related sulfurtransferase
MADAPVFSQKSDPALTSGFRSASAAQLQQAMESGGEQQCTLLDVRTEGEYAAEHLPGSRLMPLHELETLVGAARNGGSVHLDADALERLGLREGVQTYILCQTGGRARRAAATLSGAGVGGCVVVDGGIDACRASGLGVLKGESRVLPLMRQVQIVIGAVCATGAALAVWRDPMFGLIPLFMGLGLLFAGLTGTCGLALLMARMPWNKGAPGCGSGNASCAVGNGVNQNGGVK